MVHGGIGIHHAHRKKTTNQKTKTLLSLEKWKKKIDQAVYAVGIFALIMTIPQLTKIWIEQNATGVSPISWSAYLLSSIFWTLYGIIHNEKPIIVIYGIWIVLGTLIVIGTLLYG